MNEDPRHRNENFDLTSLSAYLDDYADRLKSAVLSVDRASLDAACQMLHDAAAAGKRVYAIGNGGSAAIADHLCCDWTKGTHVTGHPVIDSLSLTSNVALYSAIANDYGFEKVFSTQLDFLGQPGDILVAISSSGQSANILSAVEAAKKIGMQTIGFSGFDGGALRSTAAVSLHVDVNNYGVVEDAHQVIMHVIAQFVALHRDS